MKYAIISFVFVVTLNAIGIVANCQDTYNPQLKTFTPSTPNAASLGKFGEYPVDLSSGLVNISIPLYEVKSSKLSLPITLSYHASGIKVGDQASCVGLGWALQAGGMISRNVREKIDEFNGYLRPSTDIKPTNTIDPYNVAVDFDYLKSFSETGNQSPRDAQPDIFSYTLSGKSGQFFFDKDKTTIITIPYDEVKITNGAGLPSFTIVDTDGTTYVFGKTLDGADCFESATMPTGVNDLEQAAKIGWLLSAIISADKTDTIQFKYTGEQLDYDYGISDKVEIWDQHTTSAINAYNGHFPIETWGMHTPTYQLQHFNGMQLTLEQISFKNGKIIFEKDNRQDYGVLGKKINKISIYRLEALTNRYVKTKSISFGYSYFAAYQRLKLNSLSINDENDVSVQNYAFNYNSVSPPSPTTRGIDHWGYYNGHNSNTTLINDNYINDASTNDPGSISGSTGTSNREPDLAAAQSCVLTSIYFPTGGHTDFTYELNRYAEPNQPDKDAGGLRIQQIKSYDRTGAAPIIKTYTYGENENGSGKLITPISNYTFYESRVLLKYLNAGAFCGQPVVETIRSRNFYSSPLTGLTGMDGRIVFYSFVTEYNGNPASNNGKTTYTYNYTGDPYMYAYTMMGIGKYFRQNYSWKRGNLLEKTTYSASGVPVYKQVNGYGQLKQQWYGDVGYVITPSFHIVDGSCLTPPPCNTCTYPDYENMYSYNTFSVETGNYKLINTTEYNYDQKDPSRVQIKKTGYEYDANIYEPSKITNYTSDGYEVMNFTYPLNYNTNGTTSDVFIKGIKNLKTTNDLTQVIETYKTKYKPDNILVGTLEGVLTQFKSSAPYPEIIYKLNRTQPKLGFTQSTTAGTTFTMDASYEPELQLTNYVNGNLVEQQKVNDISKSYIWDYNDALPIAEITNSTSNNTAYTSFESDGTGNWSGIITDNIYGNIPAVTGTNVYNFSGTTLSKTGLNSSTSYIVSYWSNSGAYAVNGTSANGYPKNIKTVTLNGVNWTLWEDKVSGIVKLTITGSGYIDELRLYPANAQMITYTYTPLKGLTSICDVNNMISYYDYDSLGRLKWIKDFKGNIVKTYSYSYQSATP